MAGRVVVDDDEQQIADLLKDMRRLRSRLATGQVRGTHDEFTAAATPETTYTLTYIPVDGTCAMFKAGTEQEEGTAYTVDYDTGVVTFVTALTTGQRVNFRYLITDWLVARSLPEETGLEFVTLYSVAGFDGNPVGAYDIASNAWAGTGPPAYPGATQTHNFAIGSIQGKVYAGLGVDNTGTTRAELYVYDPATDAWTALTSAPAAAKEPAYAVLDDKLYVIGGWDTVELSVVRVYNPATDSWSTVASLPVATRGAVGGVINGKIYVAGGLQSSTRNGTCYEYNPASNTWASKATMGTPVWHTAGAAVDGKLYVVGGTNGSGTVIDTVQVYNPATNTWSTTTVFPRVIANAGVTESNGLLAVHGGSTTNTGVGVRSELYFYDPATTVWTAKTSGSAKYGNALSGASD